MSILWLVLLLAAVDAVLLVVLLVRSGAGAQGRADAVRAELRAAREEAERSSRASREELARGLASGNEMLATTLGGMAEVQRAQLDGVSKRLAELSTSNQTALDGIRTTIDTRVIELQAGNEKKLEQMRATVDEKLQSTLEKRLGESFKLVSDQLESVQKGLGEMQTLATGVGDLKRVLTNVKARGTWAEVQLGALLEEILAPGQFERNVHVEPGSREMVEYAVKLPGPKDEPGSCVWLPIDSKLPQEDYVRIQDAADIADAEATLRATDALARAIRVEAQSIHDKYVKPPHTTDFGIMFLATEGLYAEVVRQPALVEDLQQRYRVVVAGPTTLAALLSSLRMGFQTLAIEQQAVEVWRVLGAVKTEFAKFGDVLDKVKRQLDTASRTIEETGVRTRAMERKLRAVEQLPDAEAELVLDLVGAGVDRARRRTPWPGSSRTTSRRARDGVTTSRLLRWPADGAAEPARRRRRFPPRPPGILLQTTHDARGTPWITPASISRGEQQATLARPRYDYSSVTRTMVRGMDTLAGSETTVFKAKIVETLAPIPYRAWENREYGRLSRHYGDDELVREADAVLRWGREAQDTEYQHLRVIGVKLGEDGDRGPLHLSRPGARPHGRVVGGSRPARWRARRCAAPSSSTPRPRTTPSTTTPSWSRRIPSGRSCP